MVRLAALQSMIMLLHVKKFYRDDNNHCIILQPANPEYTPIVINQESQAGFRVIGKLTLVINKR